MSIITILLTINMMSVSQLTNCTTNLFAPISSSFLSSGNAICRLYTFYLYVNCM